MREGGNLSWRHATPGGRTALLVAALGLLAACGGGSGGVLSDAGQPDAVQEDAAVTPHDAADAARQRDAEQSDSAQSDSAPPPAFKPGAGLAITSGGGVGTSLNHEIHVSVGAPQPMGKARSQSGYSMTLGPAGQP